MSGIVKNGFAYVDDGNVWFDTQAVGNAKEYFLVSFDRKQKKIELKFKKSFVNKHKKRTARQRAFAISQQRGIAH